MHGGLNAGRDLLNVMFLPSKWVGIGKSHRALPRILPEIVVFVGSEEWNLGTDRSFLQAFSGLFGTVTGELCLIFPPSSGRPQNHSGRLGSIQTVF